LADRLSLELVVAIAVIFGGLAAACAYVIALHEYRQRMLRIEQRPTVLAAQTALATFSFVTAIAIALGWLLSRR
jgi:hypothetical protein